eukprot:344994-Chlamydomonas_euryale.AAC.4
MACSVVRPGTEAERFLPGAWEQALPPPEQRPTRAVRRPRPPPAPPPQPPHGRAAAAAEHAVLRPTEHGLAANGRQPQQQPGRGVQRRNAAARQCWKERRQTAMQLSKRLGMAAGNRGVCGGGGDAGYAKSRTRCPELETHACMNP